MLLLMMLSLLVCLAAATAGCKCVWHISVCACMFVWPQASRCCLNRRIYEHCQRHPQSQSLNEAFALCTILWRIPGWAPPCVQTMCVKCACVFLCVWFSATAHSRCDYRGVGPQRGVVNDLFPCDAGGAHLHWQFVVNINCVQNAYELWVIFKPLDLSVLLGTVFS